MIEHATINDLKTAVVAGTGTVVDVRDFHEYQSGHIPGALHVPMHTIPLRTDEIPTDRTVYAVCESGSRSWQVAAFLQQRGVAVVNVHGGMGMWRHAGFPVEAWVTA